ncbi:hypothetical protein DY975_23945, partial [Pseudomonas aeruginosa]
ARTVADPVKGRAPGSSEQLHRSGERKHGRSAPLNASPLKQPPLGSVGQLLRPALPSPRRQERDDKGRALGVALRVPRGSVPLGCRRRRCDRDRYSNGLRRTPVVGLVR